MDKKIKRFEINSDFYVVRAVQYEMDGDMISAVKNVKRALEIQDDVYLTLKCAAYYELMEMYEQANDIYFKLLVEKGDIMHCYYALSDNMFCLMDEAAGVHYLNKYTSLAQSEESREEASTLVYSHMEELRRKNFSLVPEWADSPRTAVMKEASDFMDSGRVEQALELYKQVPPGSLDYVEARNNAAYCLMCMGECEASRKAGEEVLRIEPGNTYALANLVKVETDLGRQADAERHLKLLLESDLSDTANLRRACIALLDCNREAEAIEALKRYLAEQKYDLDMMQMLAIALYNTGDYEESCRYFSDIAAASDRYHIASYYKRLAYEKREGWDGSQPKRLAYRQQVPDEEVERRLQLLKTYVNRISRDNCAQIWGEREFIEVLDWAFSLEDSELNYFMIRDLAGCPCRRQEEYFDELLISCFTDNSVKRHALYYQCVSGKKTKIWCVFDNILKEIKLYRALGDLPRIFAEAYSMAVATLALCASKFERGLNKALSQSAARYRMLGREFKKTGALAAALVYGSGLGGSLSDVKFLSGLFACKPDTMAGYIRLLGLGDSQE